MATAIIQHRVKDYDAWRRVYDGVGDMQKAGGVVAESVYRREGDPNTVLVFHQFTSMSKAHDFVTSPQLRDAMQRAGVEEGTLRTGRWPRRPESPLKRATTCFSDWQCYCWCYGCSVSSRST